MVYEVMVFLRIRIQMIQLIRTIGGPGGGGAFHSIFGWASIDYMEKIINHIM